MYTVQVLVLIIRHWYWYTTDKHSVVNLHIYIPLVVNIVCINVHIIV
jgi:hypothetical protein